MRRLPALALLLLAALPLHAEAARLRLVWTDDPATTMTLIWDQVGGGDPVLLYDTEARGRDHARYALSQKPEPGFAFAGMDNRVVRLRGLRPGTVYHFLVKDGGVLGRPLSFRTAPDRPQPFTFIAGGDSRDNPAACTRGNRLVARLRPLFVLYGGDYTSSGTPEQWRQYFDNWQETIAPDGRCTPFLPTRGNHENDEMVHRLFATPHPQNRYACDVGGSLMRVRVLNSELPEKHAPEQNAWLAEDFAAHPGHRWKVVAYHKPMRPHTANKAEGNPEYDSWAALFHAQGVHLACESDTHMCKYTYPLVPGDGPGSWEGFVRDDARGTVFIGEGAWGAPRRPADDDKPWTMASGSFFHFQWIAVTPDELLIRTVLFDEVEAVEANDDRAPERVPPGLRLWRPPTGEVLRLPFSATHPSYTVPPRRRVLLEEGIANWVAVAAGEKVPDGWRSQGVLNDRKAGWKTGAAPLGFGAEGLGTSIGSTAAPPAAICALKAFASPLPLAAVALEVRCNAGAILHLNGEEIGRVGLPPGPLAPGATATAAVPAAQAAWRPLPLRPEQLATGMNRLAVELRPPADPSLGLVFDLRISGEAAQAP